MKAVINVAVSVLSVLILIILSGCSKDQKPKESMTLSQVDIDRLIEHKKEIDRITRKYDQILSKIKRSNHPEMLEKGKGEINSYLKSKGVDPVFFMRKSKKILKGYIAFINTGDEIVKRRERILKEQNLSKKEIEANLEAFKKEKERSFKELTANLSDYEIELIRTNLKRLSSVVRL